ncbi:MAG: hypothetical protein QXM56_03035, partial [Acidilobaceae archaeon]
MAYYYERPLYRVLLGQILVLAYSALATIIGINIWTFLIIIAFSIASSQLLNKIFKGPFEKASKRVEEILSV